MAKKERTVKTPKVFRKTYTEKKFAKKILKRIHLPADKKFVESLFTKGKDGTYTPKGEVPAKEKKRLKGIAKAIKANKGLFVTWRAAVIGIVVGAIIVFNLFFLDSVVENTMENAMEKVFKAKVDIDGTDISVSKGRISFSSMSVADAENPMTNLFELDSTAFDIDIGQALRRRVIIEQIQIEGIAWNTPREKSGALEETPNATGSGEGYEKDEGSGQIMGIDIPFTSLSMDPESFDYEALIAEQADKLPTVQKINTLVDRSTETKEKWEKELEVMQGDLDSAKGIVDQISSVNTANLTDVTKIRGTIEEISGAYETVNGLTSRAGDVTNEIEADIQLVTAELNTVMDGINNDYNYLIDFINLPTSGKLSLVSGIAEEYLNQRFGKIYGYAKKGLTIVKNLSSKKGEEAARGTGRMVIFPRDELPDILIRDISISSSAETGLDLSGQLKDITNDQEKLGRPFSFTADARDLPGTVSVDGFADTRIDAKTALGMNLGLSGFPFDSGESLSAISISALTGGVSGDINIDLSTLTDGTGSLGIILADTRATITADNLVMNTLEDILNDSPEITLSCDFSFEDGAISVSNLKNNLDSLINDKIGSLIDEQVAAVEARLRTEVQNYLSAYLEDSGIGGDFLDDEVVTALSQIKSVDDLNAILDSKQDEANQRISDLTGAARQRVEETVDEVTEEIEEEAEEVLDSVKDKLPTLPGLP